MALLRTAVRGLALVLVLSSLPLFAIRKGDAASSQNGAFANCGSGSTCPVINARGVLALTGFDKSNNSVTVTISLYDWGCLGCTPEINSAVIDVVLTGTDSIGIQSFVVKGSLPSPGYVSCGDGIGIGCVNLPEPDGQNIQEPTPIQGADKGANTRWDFGGIAPVTIPFDSLVCESDGTSHDSICRGPSLGEAVLAVKNSVNANNLSKAESNYSVTLTDGTVLGTLKMPTPPTKQVSPTTNNTLDTATVITQASYSDYTDASQAYPQINVDGTEQYPESFTPLPLNNPPPCNPEGDNRTFRTAWYTYTAPSDGFITVSTAGSHYDTLVYVFTGSPTSPTVVSCVDDPASSGGLLQAVTTFNTVQGTTYEIMVGETPTSLVGGVYPLSDSSILYFALAFSTAPSATTSKITASPNVSTFGQPVTYNEFVTSKIPGVITGTVTFSSGSTVLGTATLNGGVANLTVITGTAEAITASYGGSSYFSSSTASILHSVKKATTKVKVSSNQNPSGLGLPVAFTAVITPQYSGQATGTMTFKDNGTTLGTGTVTNSSATLTTTALTSGANSITAVYGGDTNFLGSTSSALTQNVRKPATGTLSSSSNPSIFGNSVTFTVTVTSTEGNPGGPVKILNGTTLLATITLVSGSATYTTSTLPVGTNVITADYTGNPTFGGDTSAPVDQVVVSP